MANCFVYGTLMYPEVLTALIGRMPRHAKATLRGHERYAIRGQVFPGTIPGTADSKVAGLVLYELSPEELYVFDEFEGEEYYKVRVQPELEEGGSAEADVYLWQDALRPCLLGSAWDPDGFRQQHLASYVKMCERFAASLRK